MAEKYLKVRLEAEKLFNEGLSVVEVAVKSHNWHKNCYIFISRIFRKESVC